MNTNNQYTMGGAPTQPDDQDAHTVEGFLNLAKQGLVNDIVELHSREDFDSYMRDLESRFYKKANVPTAPYEEFPEFPPKPFQTKKRRSQIAEDSKKDFIDKVNEANLKRTQAFGGNMHSQQMNQSQLNQSRFYESLQKRSVDPYSNPFFDTVFNKQNNLLSYAGPGNHNQYQAHTPSIGAHSGGLNMPHQFGNPLSASLEPASMAQVPSYLSKFVAGPARLEANPLGEPARTMRTLSPNSSQGRQGLSPTDFDLKNPDVQYERYKNLMASQYYNANVNSQHIVPSPVNMTQPHTVYRPPSTFSQGMNSPLEQQEMMYQQQMQQQMMGMNQQPPQMMGTPQMIGGPTPQMIGGGVDQTAQFPNHDMFNISFNPLIASPQHQQGFPRQQSGPQFTPSALAQNGGMPHQQQQKPHSRIGSVSLYSNIYNYSNQQQNEQQRAETPGSAEFYRALQQKNLVDEQVIDSIGGIQDTLKQLMKSQI